MYDSHHIISKLISKLISSEELIRIGNSSSYLKEIKSSLYEVAIAEINKTIYRGENNMAPSDMAQGIYYPALNSTDGVGYTWIQYSQAQPYGFNPLENNVSGFYRWSSDGVPGTVYTASKVHVRLKIGRHTLIIEKDYSGSDIDVTQEDIDKAKVDFIKSLNVSFIVKKSERKAENLLRSFVSEIDFRNYKEKGYFEVRNGNHLFRINKESSSMIDTWEKSNNCVFIPKNRLCVQPNKSGLPASDIALQRLMLIRSGKIFDIANKHNSTQKEITERDLALV